MSFVKFVFVNKLTSSTYQHNSYIVWSNQYAKNLIPIQHICGRQCSTRKTESISFYSNVKICRVERTEIWNFLFLTLCAWCAKLLWDYRSYADSHTLSQCDILLLVFFEHCLGHNSSINSCSRFMLNDHPTSYHIVYRSIYSVYAGKFSCLYKQYLIITQSIMYRNLIQLWG